MAGANPAPGNLAMQSVMTDLNGTAYYPTGVQVALHGHVHDFGHQLRFHAPRHHRLGQRRRQLDVALPDPLPAGILPAPGTTLDKITHHSSFGFMLMERRASPAKGWLFKSYTVAGKLLTTCTQTGSSPACDKSGFVAP